MVVNGSICLLVQYLADPDAEPLSRIDCIHESGSKPGTSVTRVGNSSPVNRWKTCENFSLFHWWNVCLNLLTKLVKKTGETLVKLFHRSSVHHWCGEFIQFPILSVTAFYQSCNSPQLSRRSYFFVCPTLICALSAVTQMPAAPGAFSAPSNSFSRRRIVSSFVSQRMLQQHVCCERSRVVLQWWSDNVKSNYFDTFAIP